MTFKKNKKIHFLRDVFASVVLWLLELPIFFFFFQQQPGLNELFSFRVHQRTWCEEAHSNMVSNTVESSLPYLVTSTKADLCVEKSEALILNMVSFYPLQAIVFVVEQAECSLSICYKHYLKSVTLGD